VGCLLGLALLLLLATILVVRSCRTKRVMNWNVLPQEESSAYVLSANA
jgi:hypothetical protein